MPKTISEEKKHDKMQRANSAQNPVILNSATMLRQPKGFPFNAQLVLGAVEAKILVKIISKLQEPIRFAIERKDPLQLPLFNDPEDNEYIQMDFELSEFGVDPTNYRNLRAALVKMQSYYVWQDTVYYNKLVEKEIEAIETMPLIAKVLMPKKYERYFSIKISKDVAQQLIKIPKEGYTKYILEISMRSSSKYASLIYQFLGEWRDMDGTSITIENLKKKLGLSGKYKKWTDFNTKVIRPAYEELYENADIWFEYEPIKKDGEYYKINFKIVRGYLKVLKNPDDLRLVEEDNDIIFTLDISNFTQKEKQCYEALKYKLLINDDNIIGQIISEKVNDFFAWWDVNSKKLDKIDNPAGSLLYYLKMTLKFGWTPQKWIIESTQLRQEKATLNPDYSEKWQRICDMLVLKLGRSVVDTWFNSLYILDIKDKIITLRAPSKFVYEYIESNYIDDLGDVLRDVFKDEGIILNYNLPPNQ